MWVRLNGLESIVREYGLESEQIIEATTVLKSALNELEDALEVKYGDRVLICFFYDRIVKYLIKFPIFLVFADGVDQR